MKTTPCQGCGKPIVFAKNSETGKLIPLDPKALVYHYNGGDLDGEFEVHRLTSAWVSHFATCPNASQFSGKNRKAPSKEG